MGNTPPALHNWGVSYDRVHTSPEKNFKIFQNSDLRTETL